MEKLDDQDMFYSSTFTDTMSKSMNDFWKTATEIKMELGDNSRYLTEYLLAVFSRINLPDVLNTASAGENAYSSFWSVITSLLGSGINREGYPFYDEMKQYIQSHPINYKDRGTKSGIYMANTLFHNVKSMVDSFIEDISQDLENDDTIQKSFEQISEIVGNQKAQHLESTIDKAFIVCPTAMVFIQAVIARFAGELCVRDPQTSKHIFEIVLDSKNSGI